ncbi:MAG: tetratricopeptide repeat protein [Azospirillum sp.]|nr:tetratricopeptide repeat protein [Azospirillum sp.]
MSDTAQVPAFRVRRRIEPGRADGDGIYLVSGESIYPIGAALEQALQHHEAGRIVEADSLYRLILTVERPYADSLHLLGVIARQRGKPDDSVDLIDRALSIRPAAAPYHNNLANALRDLGQFDQAAEHYRRALALRPSSAEIHNNLGNVLRDRGLLHEAADHYHQALNIAPEIPEIIYNLANVLADVGDLDDAENLYRRALALAPDYTEAHYNLGRTLIRLNRLDEAESQCRAAVALDPDHVASLNNLGTILQERGRLGEAEACYAAVLRRDPGHAEALYNWGCALLAQNRCDDALNCFGKALAARPGYGAARIALCMAHLPVLYADDAEIERHRRAYELSLRALCAEVGNAEPQPRPQSGPRTDTLAALAEAVGAIQPFFLAYQGRNDRALRSLYGSLVCRLVAANRPAGGLAPPPGPGERIRVGIVSGFFCDHTVWQLFLKGWLTRLDRRRFQVLGYHTGTRRDGQTDLAGALCDRFLEGRQTPARWVELVAADRPHILLYPEIGMDPTAAHLAAHRLAPVQCTTWGHPNTSGMPTIDYFLTSALMEPPDGPDGYTERLVRLPNLGLWYEPDDSRPSALSRAELGLRPEAVAFWCGQALYKYLPGHDGVFPAIVRAAAGTDCQFVFIQHARAPAVTGLFRQRLTAAFAEHGLDAGHHCQFLSPMDQGQFIAAVGLSDIILDSIGWSGGKSTLDCLAHDLPIVTLAGPLMRGRHTAAILTRMGITATSAGDVADYIEIAARLARDADWRAGCRAAVAAGKPQVFYDRAVITALEAFLEHAVTGTVHRAAGATDPEGGVL